MVPSLPGAGQKKLLARNLSSSVCYSTLYLLPLRYTQRMVVCSGFKVGGIFVHPYRTLLSFSHKRYARPFWKGKSNNPCWPVKLLLPCWLIPDYKSELEARLYVYKYSRDCQDRCS